jgi:hypothetical protein
MSANEGFARFWLALSGALHLYYGLYFAIDAAPITAALAIAPTEPAGLIEMRAFYGGLMLALGVLFAASALRREWLSSGLVLLTVTYVGAASMRAIWMAIDGVSDEWLVKILAVEVTGAVGGALALLWLRSARGRLR